jgi:hypothetical protein
MSADGIQSYTSQIKKLLAALPVSSPYGRETERILRRAATDLLNTPKQALPDAISALCSFIRSEPAFTPASAAPRPTPPRPPTPLLKV